MAIGDGIKFFTKPPAEAPAYDRDGVLDALEAMVRCAARYQEVDGHAAYTSNQWNGTFGTSRRRPVLRHAIRVLARHGRCRIVKDAGLDSDVWCVFENEATHD